MLLCKVNEYLSEVLKQSLKKTLNSGVETRRETRSLSHGREDVNKMFATGEESDTRLEGFEPATPGSEDRCSIR